MNDEKRERVIVLATLIATERDRLRKLDPEMDALLQQEHGVTAVPVKATPAYVVEDDVPMPPNFTERVLDFLEKNAGRGWGANDIAKQLGITRDRMPTLRSTLFRLFGDKRIGKPSPGIFRAK